MRRHRSKSYIFACGVHFTRVPNQRSPFFAALATLFALLFSLYHQHSFTLQHRVHCLPLVPDIFNHTNIVITPKPIYHTQTTKMQLKTLFACASFVAAAVAQVSQQRIAFTTLPTSVQAGKSTTLKWGGGDGSVGCTSSPNGNSELTITP